MRIRIICPTPPTSRHGNSTSALRWARILRGLEHTVTIEQQYQDASCDLLVALHARRNAKSVARFQQLHPELSLVLALTGTDLYQDIKSSPEAQQSMEMATRMVVLQPLGIEEIPPHLRHKARVIFQSATPTPGGHRPHGRGFDVCVVGHLREVKDPFRTALASRLLTESSRVRVLHVGGAMSRDMEVRAQEEMAQNPRYVWLQELPRWKTRRIMARSHLLVLTSHLEGGANVISEALADAIPVISSRIPGSVGILGEDYPGYFTVGDERELAALLVRAERDTAFYNGLKEHCTRLSPCVDPARERKAWQNLLQELR